MGYLDHKRELEELRRTLEHMVDQRLLGEFSAEESARYLRLSARECALIALD